MDVAGIFGSLIGHFSFGARSEYAAPKVCVSQSDSRTVQKARGVCCFYLAEKMPLSFFRGFSHIMYMFMFMKIKYTGDSCE
jgi:hypothetical protein